MLGFRRGEVHSVPGAVDVNEALEKSLLEAYRLIELLHEERRGSDQEKDALEKRLTELLQERPLECHLPEQGDDEWRWAAVVGTTFVALAAFSGTLLGTV